MTAITLSGRGPLFRYFVHLRRPHLPRPGLAQCIAVALVGFAGIAVLAWNLSGGRLLVMDSPSMCPAVCVGSLVADQPLDGPVRVGEIVTFHPPGDPTQTFTHEVVHVSRNGSVETRGLLDSKPDPWSTPRSRIVGVVVFSGRDLGWLLRALPLVALAVGMWALGRSSVRASSRRAWDTIWLTFLAVVPLWTLRPLLRVSIVSMSTHAAHKGSLAATFVNTGLLPITLGVDGSAHRSYAAPGNSGHIAGPASRSGHLYLHEAVSLRWWGWLVVVSVVALPLARRTWGLRTGAGS
jgi:hypothetical protein